jgi:E3 ubiquitin-protein ligase TRIP12
MSVKSKAIAAGSSRLDDDDGDVDMLDAEFKPGDSEPEDSPEVQGVSGEHDDDDDDDGGDPGDRNDDGGDDEGPPPPGDAGRDSGGIDENAAMAIFGDYRQFGSFMVGLSSRLKTMLNNIKLTADPTTRLVTLQELSELLSISTEDTLAGSFQVEQFVKELVKILGGRGGDDEDEDDGEEHGEQDDDPGLAAALAMSTGTNTFQGDENLEAQVLACRCLANLMEALPGVAHTVVYHGAIPVLCRKLIEISYIDLAEQTLSVGLFWYSF